MSPDPLLEPLLDARPTKNRPGSLEQIREEVAGAVLAGDENAAGRAELERTMASTLDDDRASARRRMRAAECLLAMGSAEAQRAKVILALLRAGELIARRRRAGD